MIFFGMDYTNTLYGLEFRWTCKKNEIRYLLFIRKQNAAVANP